MRRSKLVHVVRFSARCAAPMKLDAIPGRLADAIIALDRRQYMKCATTLRVGIVAGRASRFIPHHRVRELLEIRRRRYGRAISLLRLRRGRNGTRRGRNGTKASRKSCAERGRRDDNPRSASVPPACMSGTVSVTDTPKPMAEVSATVYLTNPRHHGKTAAGVSRRLPQPPSPRARSFQFRTVSPAPTAIRPRRTGGCGCTV